MSLNSNSEKPNVSLLPTPHLSKCNKARPQEPCCQPSNSAGYRVLPHSQTFDWQTD